MITDEGLELMAREIESQGYDRETAWGFANIIGDTPVVDEDGNLIVLEYKTNLILARLKPLAFFGPLI
jgi:hypothetical protein